MSCDALKAVIYKSPGDGFCDKAAKNMQSSAYFSHPAFIIHSFISVVLNHVHSLDSSFWLILGQCSSRVMKFNRKVIH